MHKVMFQNLKRSKIILRIKRYGPGEFWGTLTAVLGGMIAGYFTDNIIVIGYAGAWSENIGYYGYFLRKKYHDQHLFHDARISFRSLLKGVAGEFGPGELLDSFIIRPFLMGWGVKLFPTWGLLIGKIAADTIFYVPATFMFRHKMRKRIDEAQVDLEQRVIRMVKKYRHHIKS